MPTTKIAKSPAQAQSPLTSRPFAAFPWRKPVSLCVRILTSFSFHRSSKRFSKPLACETGIELKEASQWEAIPWTAVAETNIQSASLGEDPEPYWRQISFSRSLSFFQFRDMRMKPASWIFSICPWLGHWDNYQSNFFFRESHDFIVPRAIGWIRLNQDKILDQKYAAQVSVPPVKWQQIYVRIYMHE